MGKFIGFLLAVALFIAGVVTGARNHEEIQQIAMRAKSALGIGPKQIITRDPNALTLWAAAGRGRVLEPILPPENVLWAQAACAGENEVLEGCISMRDQLPAVAAKALSDSQAMRNVAYCLKSGCYGAFVVAPANACLWWALYVEAFSSTIGALDLQMQKEACSAADFGPAEQRAATIKAWGDAVRAETARKG